MSVATAVPVSAWNVSAVTNRCAAGVRATRTCAPSFTSRRASSQALYAAMPPPTQRSTRRPCRPMGRMMDRGRSAFHFCYMASVKKRRPTSPGILAALRARQVAMAALYWGPIIFLLSTIVLLVSLWKGWNLGGLEYLAVLLLVGGCVEPVWALARRLADG